MIEKSSLGRGWGFHPGPRVAEGIELTPDILADMAGEAARRGHMSFQWTYALSAQAFLRAMRAAHPTLRVYREGRTVHIQAAPAPGPITA